MKKGNGKLKFYKTLNLDKDTWKLIKEYNKLKDKMIKEVENKKDNK